MRRTSKMKRCTLFVFFACLLWGLPTGLSAQSIEEDVIYLHDGSIIRGHITEQIIGDKVKIEILGGSLFVFKVEEIEKITREPSRLQPVMVARASAKSSPSLIVKKACTIWSH